MPQLEATPIDTKGFQSLLSLVDNTANDSFELYYGLFMYNQVGVDVVGGGVCGRVGVLPVLPATSLGWEGAAPRQAAASPTFPASQPAARPSPATAPAACRTPLSSWTAWRRRLMRSRRACWPRCEAAHWVPA